MYMCIYIYREREIDIHNIYIYIYTKLILHITAINDIMGSTHMTLKRILA